MKLLIAKTINADHENYDDGEVEILREEELDEEDE